MQKQQNVLRQRQRRFWRSVTHSIFSEFVSWEYAGVQLGIRKRKKEPDKKCRVYVVQQRIKPHRSV